MKSILMAFILVSAGAASVAGFSFGVPDDLMKSLPRFGAGSDDRAPEKRSRVEIAQAEMGQANW